METRQQDAVAKGLQDAVMQAAFATDADAMPQQSFPNESGEAKPWHPRQGKKPKAVSPINGVPVPPGKPKGVKNKLTTIRDAVLEAFDMAGGAQYLYQLSQGTQSDRAAFVGLMSKVLPTQINADVSGGIKLELSWLGGRQIGTTAAQEPEKITQVVDLEVDSKGKYRIADPKPEPSKGESGAGGAG